VLADRDGLADFDRVNPAYFRSLSFLDDIDPDDNFAPQMWVLDESELIVGKSTEFKPVFEMKEINGTNHWRLRMHVEAYDPLAV
jgi:hypothetical protein